MYLIFSFDLRLEVLGIGNIWHNTSWKAGTVQRHKWTSIQEPPQTPTTDYTTQDRQLLEKKSGWATDTSFDLIWTAFRRYDTIGIWGMQLQYFLFSEPPARSANGKAALWTNRNAAITGPQPAVPPGSHSLKASLQALHRRLMSFGEYGTS